MAYLKIERLVKGYGATKIIDELNLSVNAHETMVVMGPSGCGKTTLLLTILGAVKADQGDIIIDEKPVNDLPIEERGIAYVPQDYGLFPHLTAYDNISFGLRVRNVSETEKISRVDLLLEAVDLKGMGERKTRQLSGGEKQRVALARALAISPSILLLDEPLNSIDEATKENVRKRLKEILTQLKATTLCVVHDPEDAFILGDRIAIMHDGRIIQCETPNRLLEAPKDDVVRRLIAPMYVLRKSS
ncbi:MAG TPA: ABC transporter ATP-binding protein [Candidatus Bathyarchaeia archaeon]|nr:ABC transporter ATP-binding protein [Candidatus Bathyarchaeia archaeon]